MIDNYGDIDRLERLDRGRGARQPVLIRVTPGVRGDTHDKISTGQADSKFGVGLAEARRGDRAGRARSAASSCAACTSTSARSLLTLEPFRAAIAAIAELGEFPVYDLGGGLGVAYTERAGAAGDRGVTSARSSSAARELLGPGKRLLIEPGRSLVANGGVTLYRVIWVKHNVSTWVSVDGGMSDNLRPMLYGARYEAQIADRLGGSTRVHLAGKHCESGDVIITRRAARRSAPGDSSSCR